MVVKKLFTFSGNSADFKIIHSFIFTSLKAAALFCEKATEMDDPQYQFVLKW